MLCSIASRMVFLAEAAEREHNSRQRMMSRARLSVGAPLPLARDEVKKPMLPLRMANSNRAYQSGGAEQACLEKP